MELSLYFTVFVLVMCAIHLVWTASERINTWWNERSLISKKPVNFAASRSSLSAAGESRQRSDWYVFFHCSDLTGREPLDKEPASVRRNPTTQPLAAPSTPENHQYPSRRPDARLRL